MCSNNDQHKLAEVSIHSLHSSQGSLDHFSEQYDHSDPEKAWGVISVVHSVEDEQEQEVITSAADWTGPEDAGNPLNWSLGKKIYHTAVPSFSALASTFISSAYVPATLYIEVQMGVTEEVSLVAYAIFIFGLAIGGPLIAPCSELFGRRIVYLVTTPLLALFVMGTGFSHTITSLIMTRFFSGIFGAAPLVVAAGTIADIWSEQDRAIPMAMFVICPFLGPAFGPVLGTYIEVWKTWRWTCWVEVFFCIAVLLPTLFTKETSKRQILLKRASKLNIPGPSSPVDGQPTGKVIAYYLRNTIVRPVRMLFVEPVVFLFSLWVAFNFALLYAFFCAFEWVFLTYYKFSPQSTGLTFFGLAAGACSGFFLTTVLIAISKKKQKAAAAKGLKMQPEQRLIIAMIGGPLIPIALFIFGWSAYHHVHWIVPVFAEGLFGCANYLVFMAAISYMVDVYGPVYGASAVGANNLLRYILGGAFPLFALQLYKNLKVEWASTLLGCFSVVMMFIPFAFYRLGPWLRSKSKFVQA